jgi:hypothetical protein
MGGTCGTHVEVVKPQGNKLIRRRTRGLDIVVKFTLKN